MLYKLLNINDIEISFPHFFAPLRLMLLCVNFLFGTCSLKKSHRRPFTMVEMLIVMTVLALAASVMGFSLNRMLQEQRFKTSAEQLIDHLQAAQEMMLVMQSSVKVVITKEPRTGTYQLKTVVDSFFQSKLAHRVHATVELEGIETLQFQDEQGIVRQDLIEIKFYPSGRKMTKGSLTLSKNGWKKQIVLVGYPQPIKERGMNLAVENALESEEYFPKELRDEFLQNPSPN